MRSAPLVEYEVEKELGRGISGVVYLVHPIDDPEQSVALKRMDVSQAGPEVTEAVRAEIELLCSIEHPNIIAHLDHWQETPHGEHLICLAMETADGGDLDAKWTTAVSTKKLIREDHILSWAAGIANALAYLHNRLIVHRDIKLANV